MEPQQAIDLGREAVLTTLVISSPMLLAGLTVGLVLGVLQAVTQVQEQTIAFVPKIVVMLLALVVALPWLLMRMMEYAQELIRGIPGTL